MFIKIVVYSFIFNSVLATLTVDARKIVEWNIYVIALWTMMDFRFSLFDITGLKTREITLINKFKKRKTKKHFNE